MSAVGGKNLGEKGFVLRAGGGGETIFERNIGEFKTGAEFASQVLGGENAAAFRGFCSECAKTTGNKLPAEISGELGSARRRETPRDKLIQPRKDHYHDC